MSTRMHDAGRSSRPLHVGYLVVGLVFLGIAGSWALRVSGAVDTTQLSWLVPVVLVGAGLVGLVAFAARGYSQGRRDRDSVVGQDETYSDDHPDDHPDDYTDHYDTEQTTRIEGDQR